MISAVESLILEGRTVGRYSGAVLSIIDIIFSAKCPYSG